MYTIKFKSNKSVYRFEKGIHKEDTTIYVLCNEKVIDFFQEQQLKDFQEFSVKCLEYKKRYM
jgi:hypothetical protein